MPEQTTRLLAILLDMLKHSKEHNENSKIEQLSCSHPGQPKLVLEVLVDHPFDTTEPVLVLSELAMRMCLKEVHDVTKTHTLERFTSELVESLSKDIGQELGGYPVRHARDGARRAGSDGRPPLGRADRIHLGPGGAHPESREAPPTKEKPQ